MSYFSTMKIDQETPGASNVSVPGVATYAEQVIIFNKLVEILTQLQSALTMNGSVTANSGTDLNTSALALEDGGNLEAIKAKADNIPSDPAKESGKLATIDSTLSSIKSTDGIKKITDALPTGSNVIGKFGVQVGGADVSSTNPVPVSPPLVGYLVVAIDQSDAHNVVDIEAISTLYNNTHTVPTVTADALGSQSCRSVTVKSLSTNTVAVYVGASGCTVANGFELLPGESVSLDVNNVSLIYCISGSAAQVLRWIAI